LAKIFHSRAHSSVFKLWLAVERKPNRVAASQWSARHSPRRLWHCQKSATWGPEYSGFAMVNNFHGWPSKYGPRYGLFKPVVEIRTEMGK